MMRFKAKLENVPGLERPVEIYANHPDVVTKAKGKDQPSWAETMLEKYPQARVVVYELQEVPVTEVIMQTETVETRDGKRSTLTYPLIRAL